MLRNYNESIIVSDQIKNLKLNNLPNNLILNKDDQYTLLVKSDIMSLTFMLNVPSSVIYLPVINEQYTVYSIDWGEALYDIEHTKTLYEYKNKYEVPSCQYFNTEKQFVTIKIRGDFKGFDNSKSCDSISTNYFYYAKDPNKYVISGKISAHNVDSYLYAVNTWGSLPYSTFSKSFINSSGLVNIPNEMMPNVNECTSTFMNCVNLYKGFNYDTSTMINFRLPLNATNCIDMFRNTQIAYDFKTLEFPTHLTSISGMFYKTKITDINPDFYYEFKTYAEYSSSATSGLSTYYFGALPYETMSGNPNINCLNISSILLGG